jgi:hypothetical protein
MIHLSCCKRTAIAIVVLLGLLDVELGALDVRRVVGLEEPCAPGQCGAPSLPRAKVVIAHQRSLLEMRRRSALGSIEI